MEYEQTTQKDIVRDWKYQRKQEIIKLLKGGVTKDELVRRFGLSNVKNALSKSGWYN